jgi:hypothetical protein
MYKYRESQLYDKMRPKMNSKKCVNENNGRIEKKSEMIEKGEVTRGAAALLDDFNSFHFCG